MTLSAGHEVEIELIGTDWRKVVLSQSVTPSAGKAMVWGSDAYSGLTGLLSYNNIISKKVILPIGSTNIFLASELKFIGCFVYVSYYETTGGAQRTKIFIGTLLNAAEIASVGWSTAITSLSISGDVYSFTTDKAIECTFTIIG
jgi:hypothetical protein